jgi:thioredoxin 1
MVKVEVFVLPGCSRCSNGLDALKEIAASFGPDAFQWEERNLLQSIDDAVKLGILATPAIAVGGKLAFASLPSAKQWQAELSKHVVT